MTRLPIRERVRRILWDGGRAGTAMIRAGCFVINTLVELGPKDAEITELLDRDHADSKLDCPRRTRCRAAQATGEVDPGTTRPGSPTTCSPYSAVCASPLGAAPIAPASRPLSRRTPRLSKRTRPVPRTALFCTDRSNPRGHPCLSLSISSAGDLRPGHVRADARRPAARDRDGPGRVDPGRRPADLGVRRRHAASAPRSWPSSPCAGPAAPRCSRSWRSSRSPTSPAR